MSRTAVEDDSKIFSNTGFIYANGFTWNRIFFVNKLGVCVCVCVCVCARTRKWWSLQAREAHCSRLENINQKY